MFAQNQLIDGYKAVGNPLIVTEILSFNEDQKLGYTGVGPSDSPGNFDSCDMLFVSNWYEIANRSTDDYKLSGAHCKESNYSRVTGLLTAVSVPLPDITFAPRESAILLSVDKAYRTAAGLSLDAVRDAFITAWNLPTELTLGDEKPVQVVAFDGLPINDVPSYSDSVGTNFVGISAPTEADADGKYLAAGAPPAKPYTGTTSDGDTAELYTINFVGSQDFGFNASKDLVSCGPEPAASPSDPTNFTAGCALLTSGIDFYTVATVFFFDSGTLKYGTDFGGQLLDELTLSFEIINSVPVLPPGSSEQVQFVGTPGSATQFIFNDYETLIPDINVDVLVDGKVDIFNVAQLVAIIIVSMI